VSGVFEINVGLLSSADNSVPVSPGVGDGSKVDRNGGHRVDPPPKVLLKWRHWQGHYISQD